jgi:murein tripeptide amidase MpaA
MLLAKIRGTKEQLRLLDHSAISLQHHSAHRLADDRFEVCAVLDPTIASLLEIKGYDVAVTREVNAVLSERLRLVSKAAPELSDEDIFGKVGTNNGYMTTDYIEAWLANLAGLFPSLVEIVPMRNLTWEGRQTNAVRLCAGDTPNRTVVVFTSGVHAGELGGPDACIYFLYRLINGWRNNEAVSVGSYTVSGPKVQGLLTGLDLFVFPCVNPDGRAYVFEKQDWWRKNRNPNVGMNSVGVDINRNYDFLWASGIGSSPFPQDDTYRGAAPFSEPETRNVAWLIQAAAANYYMDIHGPSGTLVYVWGDAQDQSTNPSMSFQNPAWDGRRDGSYGEYLTASDGSHIRQLGDRVVGAVNAVRKGSYESEPSYSDLYPTTATSDDYTFSRHLVDSTQTKAYAYTFEYGGGDFFPSYPDMVPIIAETNAGMLEFCMAAMST